MTAITWGWQVEETAERLMEESAKAQGRTAMPMPSSPRATQVSPWNGGGNRSRTRRRATRR